MDLSFQLNEKNWGYLAEGNQHIILKYCSNPLDIEDNFLYNKVLKIDKICCQKKENSLKIQNFNDFLDHYIRQKLYQKNTTLLQYLLFEEKILVSNKSDFLMKISEKIETFRPENRRSKSINLCSDVILSENLRIFCLETKGFVIEIKPKSPLKEFIEKNEYEEIFNKNFKKYEKFIWVIYENIKEKLKELRFIKMQIVKTEENNGINDGIISDFDPRMLFENEGVSKALESLMRTPLNNFIIHHNNSGFKKEDLIEEIEKILRKERVLFEIILKYQKSFEGNIAYVKKIAEQFNLEDFEKYLNSNKELLKDPEKEKINRDMMNFLISLTWKDLGIMINFVMDEGVEEHNARMKKNDYKVIEGPLKGFYRIGLIDIKLKGVEKLLNYGKTQEKINEVYLLGLILNYIKKHKLN